MRYLTGPKTGLEIDFFSANELTSLFRRLHPDPARTGVTTRRDPAAIGHSWFSGKVQRIAIVGAGGAGKTILASRLLLGLPVTHLDALRYDPAGSSYRRAVRRRAAGRGAR